MRPLGGWKEHDLPSARRTDEALVHRQRYDASETERRRHRQNVRSHRPCRVFSTARHAGDDTGKSYDHIAKDEFFRRLDGEEFLEYAQVYGDYYATPKHPAIDHLASGRDILLEIDVQGAMQVRHHYPNALLIFILPPDEPTLLRRLTDRGRDSAEDIHKRFRAAKREIHMAKGSRAFDYMVINDNLEQAVEEIVKIIKHKRAGGI